MPEERPQPHTGVRFRIAYRIAVSHRISQCIPGCGFEVRLRIGRGACFADGFAGGSEERRERDGGGTTSRKQKSPMPNGTGARSSFSARFHPCFSLCLPIRPAAGRYREGRDARRFQPSAPPGRRAAPLSLAVVSFGLVPVTAGVGPGIPERTVPREQSIAQLFRFVKGEMPQIGTFLRGNVLRKYSRKFPWGIS